jgi:ABC-type Fe3+-hydroxamate transport system substrate-binding protein
VCGRPPHKLVVARWGCDDIILKLEKKEDKMSAQDSSIAFIKEYQERFEKKLKENEIALLEHWKDQLDKIVSMRPDGIASLQMQVKKTSDMMANRIKVLKKE